MRLPILLLLLAVPALAQVCPTLTLGQRADGPAITRTGIVIWGAVNNPADNVTRSAIAFSNDNTLSFSDHDQSDHPMDFDDMRPSSGQDSADVLHFGTSRLTPGVTQWIDPRYRVGASTWVSMHADCQEQIAAFDCGGATGCAVVDDGLGGKVIQITPPNDTVVDLPNLPNHSGRVVSDFSTLTETPQTVGAGCESPSFDTAIAAAQAEAEAAPGVVAGVYLPPGVECDEMMIPGQSEAGSGIVIYSANPNVPPIGGRREEWHGRAGGVVQTAVDSRVLPLVSCASTCNNISLRVLDIRRPELADMDLSAFDRAFTGYSSPLLTFSPAVNSAAWITTGNNRINARVFANNLQRVAARFGSSLLVGTTTTINVGSDAGTYSGGWMTKRVSSPWTIAAMDGGSSPTITLDEAGPYINRYAEPVATVSDAGVVTVATPPTPQEITNNAYYAYRLRGTDDGMGGDCDGIYTQITTTNTTDIENGVFRFDDYTPAKACTGGTIERPLLAYFHDLSIEKSHRVCLIDVLSSTEIQVLSCTDGETDETPSWADGTTGWMALDSPSQPVLVATSGFVNLTLDRVLADGGAPPWRSAQLISAAGSSGLLVQGSVLRGSFWRAENPVTDEGFADTVENRSELFAVAKIDGATNLQFIDNNIIGEGYLAFGTSAADVAVPTDITYRGNHVQNPEWAGGIREPKRQSVELKSGWNRALFQGNTWARQRATSVPAGHCIAALVTVPGADTGAVVREGTDLTISHNTLDCGRQLSLGAIQLEGGAGKWTYSTRALVEHNVFRSRAFTGGMAGDQLSSPSGGYTDQAIQLTTRWMEDLTFRRNTILPPANTNDENTIIEKNSAGAGQIDYSYNLLGLSQVNASALKGIRTGSTSTWAGVAQASWSNADTGFSNNIVVPANEVATDSNFTVSNNAYDGVVADLPSYVGFTVVGANGQSALTRWNAALATYGATHGADLEVVADWQGRVRGIEHTAGTSSFTVTATAPSDGACTLRYWAAPMAPEDTPLGSLTMTGGTRTRSGQFTGLTAATEYDYEIQCVAGAGGSAGNAVGRISTGGA